MVNLTFLDKPTIVFQMLIAFLVSVKDRFSKKEYWGILDTNLRPLVYHNWNTLVSKNYRNSMFVYAGTVGELNAARVFIEQIEKEWPEDILVLFTGQNQYLSVFKNKYPNAVVIGEFTSSPLVIKKLFDLAKPRFTAFIEGPSLLCRFPIRLELGIPIRCLVNKIPVLVVNACLYKSHISGRIDKIENALFAPLFRKSIQKYYVSDEYFENELTKELIPVSKIVRVGNIKFDAVFSSSIGEPSEETCYILQQFRKNDNRLIVAGSVNAIEEQQALLEAWKIVADRIPGTKLVIAPRYINQKRMMESMYSLLEDHSINFARRSKGAEKVIKADVIVLDTFGELMHFYSKATVAYAGRNHGVLEPMRFNVPVVVGRPELWSKEYSTSYYLFKYMLDKKALVHVENFNNLGETFTGLMENNDFVKSINLTMKTIVNAELGATSRIVKNIKQDI